MKVGIVVPFSWSFWGAVVEHAELQAAALRELRYENDAASVRISLEWNDGVPRVTVLRRCPETATC